MNEQIKAIMKNLKCSEEEAKEIYEADCAIDHDEPMDFDLTPEQEKVAKQYTRTGTRKAPTVYKFDQKERKQDPIKRRVIQDLLAMLQEKGYENPSVLNPEREVIFNLDGCYWSVTLTKHGKKWKGLDKHGNPIVEKSPLVKEEENRRRNYVDPWAGTR